MNSHSTHGVDPNDLHDLAPLYAVDALEPDERAGFEQHLSQCLRCQGELEDYAEVGAQLASGAATEPPPELRASVLSTISGTHPLPAPAPEDESADSSTPQAAAGQSRAQVVSLDERRSRRGRRLLAGAAAAAVVAGVALGGWNLGARWEQREQEQLAAQQEDRETRLLSAPDVTTHRIDVDGRAATLVVSRDQDAALFVAADLPDPGEGREYQLWLLEGETPLPDVHFAGGETRIWLSGDLAQAGGVAMTVEPAGGSTTPTLPLLASTGI